jgi:hypothetical protein
MDAEFAELWSSTLLASSSIPSPQHESEVNTMSEVKV